MDNIKSKRDILDIKRDLSNELLTQLRNVGNEGFDVLLDRGYSKDEIAEMLTSYNSVSGADLVNCNDALKVLRKKLDDMKIYR